jgi:endonuclease/exonuclease/phosphatase family metal-dependent hydrolase
MKPVSIISNNTYQIPGFMVKYYATFMKDVPVDQCRDQEPRAKRLCELLQKHDICILQEMWGSQSHFISNCLIDYNKPKQLDDYVWSGIGADYWNTIYSFFRSNGGLYFASKSDLPIIWYKHHTFNHGEKLTNKSLGITLLDMKSRWGPNKYLLVLNVHYFSPEPMEESEIREKQRKETRDVLMSLKDTDFGKDFNWSNCGVIYAGDFNVSYKNREDEITLEYKKLIRSVTPEHEMRNLREECNSNQYLNTFNILNTYIPEKIWNECSTLDYIFTLDYFPTTEGPVKTMRLETIKVEVLHQPPYLECSDHYPISAIIKPS